MRCPNCKSIVHSAIKQWPYRNFKVELFQCSCGAKFNAYFGTDGLSHIITLGERSTPDSKGITQIKRYLRVHGAASEEELADKLNLRIEETHRLLIKMQRKGEVENK